jgi:hypothetical protein
MIATGINTTDHKCWVTDIHKHFKGVIWISNEFHAQNFDAFPKSVVKELNPHQRTVLDAPNLDTAKLLLNRTVDTTDECKASQQ